MDEDDLDAAFVCMITATTLLNVYAILSKANQKRKHRVWVNKYLHIGIREKYGAYNSLMRDLVGLDNVKFRNYIRMEPEDFEELFVKIEPMISTKNTKFR